MVDPAQDADLGRLLIEANAQARRVAALDNGIAWVLRDRERRGIALAVRAGGQAPGPGRAGHPVR